jgi:ZIP family zinc transporter
MAAVTAASWGLLGGSALLVGAWIGWRYAVPSRLIAAVMAFGAGVLISALSFELMDDGYRSGGLAATASGFLAGAALFTGATIALAHHGARHRKRSGHDAASHQPSDPSSGMAIALGALLDGIPESIVIGVSLLQGPSVSLVAVAAVFLSNIPEGLSSAAGMKRAGRSAGFVLGVWAAIALASAAAAAAGYVLFRGTSPQLIAATQAVAAGAILAMVADTMIPEAFETAHDYAGLVTVLGFLTAFALSHAGA